MAEDRVAFIVNPNAGKGRCGREWKSLQRLVCAKFPVNTTMFSQYPMHPIQLVQELIADGWQLIVAVGGDGTLNECVNGYMLAKGKENDVSLGMISLGTGGDFCRTLGVPADADVALEVIAQGYRLDVDVGLIRFGDGNSVPEDMVGSKAALKERYFINMAGAGVGGEVCENVKKSSNRFGGKITYMCVSVSSTLRFVNRRLKYRIDGGDWRYQTCFNFIIANGQYQGGGMKMAPEADIADGSFDVVVLGDMRLFGSLFPFVSKVYSGTHTDLKDVTVYRGVQSVEVRPDDRDDRDVHARPALVELDGEPLDEVPLTATILPRGVSMIVPFSFLQGRGVPSASPR